MIARLAIACAAALLPAVARAADYTQVHAILERSCVNCHGPNQSRSGLRLDTASGIRKGGEHGPAVIPGFPADSGIYARCCLPGDDSDAMPAKGPRLSADDLTTISNWILAGATAPAEAPADKASPASAAVAAGDAPARPAGGSGGMAAAASGTDDAMAPAAGSTMEPASGSAMAAGTMAPAASAPSAPRAASAASQAADGAVSPTADADYAPVKAIFASSCIQCHGPNKQKGKLRLDTVAFVRAGGKSGAAVVPGAPERSLLVTRISLPADDSDIMPADGPHLNPAQIATVVSWIKDGAWTRAPAGSTAFVPPIAPGATGAAGQPPTTPAKAFNPMDAPDTELDRLAKGMAAPDAKALDALVADGMWWRPVCKNGALVELDCRQVAAKDLGVALTKLGSVADHVVWLNLAGTGIDDAELEALGGIKHLQRLHLERTGVGDAGLGKLAACHELAYLNLYGTQVGDAGVAKLAPLKRLAQLFLRDTKATPEGAAKLQAEIPGLSVVFDEALPTGPLPENKKKGKKQN